MAALVDKQPPLLEEHEVNYRGAAKRGTDLFPGIPSDEPFLDDKTVQIIDQEMPPIIDDGYRRAREGIVRQRAKLETPVRPLPKKEAGTGKGWKPFRENPNVNPKQLETNHG